MAKGFDCCETTVIYSEVQSSYVTSKLSIIMMLIDRNPAVCVCDSPGRRKFYGRA